MIKLFSTLILVLGLLSSAPSAEMNPDETDVTICIIFGNEAHPEILWDFENTNHGLVYHQDVFGYEITRIIDESYDGVAYVVYRGQDKLLFRGVWTVGDLLEKIYPVEIRKTLLNPKIARL